MNEELHGFLKDLFGLIQEKYNESLLEESKPATEADAAYRRGVTFAYYDVLDLVRLQLIAFGHNEDASGFIVPEFGKPSNSDA